MWLLFLLPLMPLCAQQDTPVLGFEEYLGYVKKYHPITKQAQLTLAEGQANLMMARGGFDPKVAVDYQRKEFKGIPYWERLNTTFKIPTWFGITLQGSFKQNTGEFINPDETLPDDGLYSAGISLSLLQGFWINERMATLRKAKLFREQSKADQDLLVNEVLYQAALAYFDWWRAYQDTGVFKNFLRNAQTRFQGVKQRTLAGDMAVIDTVEANIAVQNRALSYEQAQVKLMKTSLALSNFLWINDIPVELQSGVAPDTVMGHTIDTILGIAGRSLDSFTLENHPKLRSLRYKIDGLVVDKRFKANKLLPRLEIKYDFLTESPEQISTFVPEDAKAVVNFQFPLFLRKERGVLKLAKLKLKDTEFERDNAQVEIQNKVIALYKELDSYTVQNRLMTTIVESYSTLLAAEERKFSFGESSLFLINTRESKLIDAFLKQNTVRHKFFQAKALLFKSLALTPENLQ